MATEKRLIDANALLEWNEKEYGKSETRPRDKFVATIIFSAIKGAVKFAPTVDAVEVVHGRWNEKQEQIPWCEDDVDTYWMCSVCGAIEIGKTNYCHNCGAKMDGDGNG